MHDVTLPTGRWLDAAVIYCWCAPGATLTPPLARGGPLVAADGKTDRCSQQKLYNLRLALGPICCSRATDPPSAPLAGPGVLPGVLPGVQGHLSQVPRDGLSASASPLPQPPHPPTSPPNLIHSLHTGLLSVGWWGVCLTVGGHQIISSS